MGGFWVFAGALGLAYLVPGPDMVLILQTSALRGRAHAFAVAAGLAAARAIHVGLAAVGLAALLQAAPTLFDIVRLAGAAYLVWIGIGMLRAGDLWHDTGSLPAREPRRSWSASLRRGLLTNLLNPKALLFCSVLLPQFIRADHGSVAGQFLMLGAILVATGLVFDLAYAGLGAALGRWMARHPFVRRLQKWVFAGALIGFGLRLALGHRSS